MSLLDTRRDRLGAVLVTILVFTLLMLVDVLGTLFFAVTLASVLLPVKRRLEGRGVPDRLAAGLATSVAFVALVLPELESRGWVRCRRPAVHCEAPRRPRGHRVRLAPRHGRRAHRWPDIERSDAMPVVGTN